MCQGMRPQPLVGSIGSPRRGRAVHAVITNGSICRPDVQLKSFPTEKKQEHINVSDSRVHEGMERALSAGWRGAEWRSTGHWIIKVSAFGF